MEQRSTISALLSFETRNACSFSYCIGFWCAIHEAHTPWTNVCVYHRRLCAFSFGLDLCHGMRCTEHFCVRVHEMKGEHVLQLRLFSVHVVRLVCRVDFSFRFIHFNFSGCEMFGTHRHTRIHSHIENNICTSGTQHTPFHSQSVVRWYVVLVETWLNAWNQRNHENTNQMLSLSRNTRRNE